jgi:hypothetical protein
MTMFKSTFTNTSRIIRFGQSPISPISQDEVDEDLLKGETVHVLEKVSFARNERTKKCEGSYFPVSWPSDVNFKILNRM